MDTCNEEPQELPFEDKSLTMLHHGASFRILSQFNRYCNLQVVVHPTPSAPAGTGVIYDRAMKQGLVSESAGKTPEATMAAALYTDIKKYREQSTFIKPREGLFGLRDWNQEGCDILVSRAQNAWNCLN